MKKINVLNLGAEAAPFAKVGGLADVLGSLPGALNAIESGYLASVVIPCYQVIDKKEYKLKSCGTAKVLFQDKEHQVRLYQTFYRNVRYFFVENAEFLGGSKIYLTGKDELLLEAHRFEFFAMAVLQLLSQNKLKANILHCHDWHAVPILPLSTLSSVFTIHNLANQGVLDKSPNFMKLGIENADIITTVSPSYRDEVLTEKFGEGMQDILKKREDDFYGILNGIDYRYFDPRLDPNVKYHFNEKHLEQKIKDKVYLQKILGMKSDEKGFLVGIVSRLVLQKGIELAVPNFEMEKTEWAILGSGEPEVEEVLREGTKDKKNVYWTNEFRADLANQIYAGADLFFMPSRFEPCGLGQMIAMHFGALPFVRKVGGLRDTVEDGVNGFVFEKDEEIKGKLEEAKDLYYHKPDEWRAMQVRAMKKDFSWEKSAKKYLELYKKLID